MEKIWETHSPAETAALGEEMGKNCKMLYRYGPQ